jgi:uncharacterized membrane protein HdeD (DUF308 family)
MSNVLVRYWWAVALRGLLAVVFGLLALIWPGVTLASMVLFFGVYALVDGVFSIAAAVRQRDRWGAMVLKGLLGIGAGIAAFSVPGITALALIYLIAAWAIVSGVLEIAVAIKLRKEIEGEVLLVLSGITSIAFGGLLAMWPIPGAFAVVTLVGIYALVFGVLLIGLGFRLRALGPSEHAAARRRESGAGTVMDGGRA